MIFYVTFNDTPSGIYSSQVIDAVLFMQKKCNADIRLVSFISLRGFLKNRKKIKAELPGALVIPMFPGIKNWRLNSVSLHILCLMFKPSVIIGRSVFATQLAFKTSVKKTVYDGRGAIGAEWHEYNVITDATMLAQINDLEREAVTNAGFRIAVSHALVIFWEKEFGYQEQDHVIIPCTVNKVFEELQITKQSVQTAKQKFKFNPQDIVLAYAGSLAGWQSFELLHNFIAPLLRSDPKIKLLFLSGADKNISKLEQEFPGKIVREQVSPNQVPACLLAADYGLLIREETVTNQVASPVKFAEYLACGLKVIISPGLGDYSEVIKNNKALGCLYTSDVDVLPVSLEEKTSIQTVGLLNYTKKHFMNEYIKLVS